MPERNVHNVYRGRDSMKKYFDPDYQPFLPLVELPDILNPFRNDGVRIYAKLMTALPCQNVKALPALNMLQEAGPLARKTIVEPSSGSTVTSMAMAARVLHGNTDVHAYVSNKTEKSRLQTLRFFGLKVHLYGGPAQPEISDPRGQIQKLRRLAEDCPEIYNPGQYENLHNPQSHVRWTGPQLLTQLPDINVFCAGMGSAGCITGTGTFLKAHKPSVTVVGVCNKVADAIPGPRPYPLFDKIAFPWKEVTDCVEEINSLDSYRLSMALSREGLICGPSSGMALQGLLKFLGRQKDKGRLQDYAKPETGEISCVFLCCDLPYQYMDAYFNKLDPSNFHPISNEFLSAVDQGTYNPLWELHAKDAAKVLGDPTVKKCAPACDLGPGTCRKASSVKVLDLRQDVDFAASHISDSVNAPLRSIGPDTPSPFDDPELLQVQFRELEALTTGLCSALRLQTEAQTKVLLLCYNGETARLASSLMRQKGIEAYSVKDGFSALMKECGSYEE